MLQFIVILINLCPITNEVEPPIITGGRSGLETHIGLETTIGLEFLIATSQVHSYLVLSRNEIFSLTR